MGILTGALTARRFRVIGDVPEGFADVYRDRLNEYAFHEPPNEPGKLEIEGWVLAHNLLDVRFDDLNRWLYTPWALFSLRIDKKTVPANLLRATVEKLCLEWCAEHAVERCPSTVKAEIKEKLEDEWLRRTLPRVKVVDLCWHTTEGWLLLNSLSESVAERVRKRFHQTFGLRLVPWSPLDYLADSRSVEALLETVPAQMGEER